MGGAGWRLMRVLLVLTTAVLAAVTSAQAQVPPSATELASYRGLHAAAARGDVEEIRRLAGDKRALNVRDGNGRTPLHVAAFQGHAAAAQALIALGADTAIFDNDRYDAVTVAAVANDVPTLAALLAGGASAKLITSRYDGTALIAAAHLGHVGAVDALIRAGAPLDHVNNLGWTALIEAVVLGDGGIRHTEVVRRLLAAGANPAIADRQGAAPLALARARGYGAMVRLLEAESR
jgi:ankyrin repeat protein